MCMSKKVGQEGQWEEGHFWNLAWPNQAETFQMPFHLGEQLLGKTPKTCPIGAITSDHSGNPGTV